MTTCFTLSRLCFKATSQHLCRQLAPRAPSACPHVFHSPGCEPPGGGNQILPTLVSPNSGCLPGPSQVLNDCCPNQPVPFHRGNRSKALCANRHHSQKLNLTSSRCQDHLSVQLQGHHSHYLLWTVVWGVPHIEPNMNVTLELCDAVAPNWFLPASLFSLLAVGPAPPLGAPFQCSAGDH